ncbi:MAG TPA: response regulator transcription factor [Trueperaceae bacterium]|nr:response regulator transcription factor [Trueperaceae bacterium]
MRVLIVEDDSAIAATLEDLLMSSGFETMLASSATSAWEALWAQPIDVVVLDVMLPEGAEAGFDWAADVRAADFRQPILFLTARDDVPDRVRGLEYGDDYLAKPFAPVEVVARLRALTRRGDIRPRHVSVGEVSIEPEFRTARRAGAVVRLTAKEYEVLELFMLNPGRTYRREEVLDRVWGAGFESPSNLVDVYVLNLRRKLGDGVLETVRGLGYRLADHAVST